MSKLASLLVFVLLVAAAATTGMMFQPGEWYAQLSKPEFTPPNSVFPVAWTILYVMIAVAGWRAWRANGLGVTVAIWAVGLVLNALWSWLMFGRHEIGLALADIYLLFAAIVAFIISAWRLDRAAALLFAPYAAWVGFASVLNLTIWQLNP